MTKIYFDGNRRRVYEEDIVRDYIGRNRERAMQMLGMQEKAAQQGPRFGIKPTVEKDAEGKEVVRVRAADDGEQG